MRATGPLCNLLDRKQQCLCIRHIDKAGLCSVKEKNKLVSCNKRKKKKKSSSLFFVSVLPRGLLFSPSDTKRCAVWRPTGNWAPEGTWLIQKTVVLFCLMFDEKPEQIEISWWQKWEAKEETLCRAFYWVPFVYKTRLKCWKGFVFLSRDMEFHELVWFQNSKYSSRFISNLAVFNQHKPMIHSLSHKPMIHSLPPKSCSHSLTYPCIQSYTHKLWHTDS